MDKRLITAISAATLLFISCAGRESLEEIPPPKISPPKITTMQNDGIDTAAANRASRYRWEEASSLLSSRNDLSKAETLLLGTARSKLGDFAAAAKLLEPLASDTTFLLDDYVRLALAEAFDGEDSVDRAVAVLSTFGGSDLEEEALSRRYIYLRGAGKISAATAALDTLISRYPSHFGAVEAIAAHADLALLSGDTNRAVQLYERVLAKSSGGYAVRAASALDKIGRLRGRNLFLGGRAAVKSKNYASGEKWLTRYIASGTKANAGEAKYLRARAISRRGRYSEAIGQYKKILSEKSYNAAWTKLGIAYCYRKIGSFDKAKSFVDAAIADGKGSNAEAEALWEGVELGEDMADYAMAADYAHRLSRRFPNHDLGDNGAMWAGLASFVNGDHSAAAERFSFIEKKYSDRIFVETGKYWCGISRIEAGDSSGGRALLRDVEKSPIRHYYRYLSAETSTGIVLPNPLSSRSEHWMTYEDAIEIARGALSEAGYKEVFLSTEAKAAARADLLAHMGLTDLAETEFERWTKQLDIDPPTRLALLSIAVDWKLTGLAYDIALALVRDMGGYSTAPTAVIRLAYPTFYAPDVFAAARRENIDAALLFAVMRRESRYDPHVVSGAGAIGLFQIMPQTGKNIARDIGDGDDFEKLRLYDWHTSLNYGAKYLADLLRKHELPESAIAEYNAGPSPVKRWEKTPHAEWREAFVEGIDYRQTRHYVKNVLGDYYAYKELWDGSL